MSTAFHPLLALNLGWTTAAGRAYPLSRYGTAVGFLAFNLHRGRSAARS